MSLGRRIWLAFISVRELGVAQLANYAAYSLGLRTGLTEWASRKALNQALRGGLEIRFQPILDPPAPELLKSVLGGDIQSLLTEAENICQGKIRIFGAHTVNLDYSQGKSEVWFTRLEQQLVHRGGSDADLKLIWEPARFGWVYPLARAYWVAPEERFAETFWAGVESFLDHHSTYLGYQWLSAQEVALRLIAWAFGYQIFQGASASTEQRKQRLLEALAVHAARIPCTVRYAMAQQNNHLLSEAVGLMTAGYVLKGHPLADHWWKQGLRWFLKGIREQIAADGTYIQHSTNYHRLMLQLALWARLLIVRRGEALPEDVNQRLAQAVRWLEDCCERRNGCVPNLGANDGAYIQPLSQSPFEDYRPVIQAASRAFLGRAAFARGIWDEISLWLGVWDGREIRQQDGSETVHAQDERLTIRENSWVILRSKDRKTWAALRCPRFFARPSHADMLHFDLWWEGINLACDAGTYRYTALPPWENRLSEAFHHNTLTIDGKNPMTRAGKFLWLNWAKTRVFVGRIDNLKHELTIGGEHNGYRSLGIRLQRFVTLEQGYRWHICDRIESTSRRKQHHCHQIRMHWLITPCAWEVDRDENGWRLRFKIQDQKVYLYLKAPHAFSLRLVEAGKVVFGEEGEFPVYGFYAPTYHLLQTGLSVILEAEQTLPITLETFWELPKGVKTRR
ncbi:MAG: hypothetical protein Kow0088_14990 [Anaerolineales bacterium]